MRVLVAAEPLVYHIQSSSVALLNPAALGQLDTIIVTDYTEVELSSQEVLVEEEEEAATSACVQEKDEQMLLAEEVCVAREKPSADEAASCAHETALVTKTTRRDVTCEVASDATVTTSHNELVVTNPQNEQNLQTCGSGQLRSRDEDDSTNISPEVALQEIETPPVADEDRTPVTRRGRRRPRNSTDSADKNTIKTLQRRAQPIKQNRTEDR